MRMSEAFPSKYIAAADVEREPTVAISAVEMEKVGDDHKPVVYFQGAKKGLVLNKTNAGAISQLYGDESNNWAGKHVTLFPVWTEFQGNQVRAVRVRPPDGGPRVNDPAQQAPPQQAGEFTPAQYAEASSGDGGIDLDDEIPF